MGNPTRRIRGWFQDAVFRRLVANAGRLLSANAIASVLTLGTAILTARHLGAAGYGALALAIAYGLVIQKLVAVNSWQALIRLGTDPWDRRDAERFGRLVGFSFGLDLVCAVVGAVVATSLAGPVASWLGWERQVETLLVLVAVQLLFTLEGTPIGVLRLLDRFDLLSVYALVAPAMRLVGTVIAVVVGADTPTFVMIHVGSMVLGQLWLVANCARTLQKHGALGWLRWQPRSTLRGFPELRHYVGSAYVNTVFQTMSREADEIVVAGLTGPIALGHFKVAKQIARVLPLLSDPLYQSIYPELARLWSKRQRSELRRLVRRATGLVTTVALVLWIGFALTGPWLVPAVFGPEFAPAYTVTLVYMFALVISLISFTLRPLALAVGRPWSVVTANVAATTLYFGAVFALVPRLGATGAAAAYVGYYLTWTVLMALRLRPDLRSLPGETT